MVFRGSSRWLSYRWVGEDEKGMGVFCLFVCLCVCLERLRGLRD